MKEYSCKAFSNLHKGSKCFMLLREICFCLCRRCDVVYDRCKMPSCALTTPSNLTSKRKRWTNLSTFSFSILFLFLFKKGLCRMWRTKLCQRSLHLRFICSIKKRLTVTFCCWLMLLYSTKRKTIFTSR